MMPLGASRPGGRSKPNMKPKGAQPSCFGEGPEPATIMREVGLPPNRLGDPLAPRPLGRSSRGSGV